MATRHKADEAKIRQLIARMAEAIHAADLEGLKTCFAPDIVSFDVGPQLQSVGASAYQTGLPGPPVPGNCKPMDVTVFITLQAISNVASRTWPR
jgi:ketosteroid isomerase-like protein